MKQFPIARRKDLIIEDLPDEVLVYDLTTDKAHCLNRTSALIWKNCDGEKSAGEIAELLEQEQELESPVSVQVVVLGLEELAVNGLLQEEISLAPGAQVSRRRLIQNLGLTAAIALPVIMSLSVPAAAGAGSVTDPCIANPRADGCPCTLNSDCDSGECVGGICTSMRPSK
jgi:hypothetical protein